MIVDPHMHVGDFPLFDVGMDATASCALFSEWDYEAGIVFHPDNGLVRGIVERVPERLGALLGEPA